jgi:tRNA (guanine-N7-)-methyltransferase
MSQLLHYPFPWEERRPALCERVLFVPPHYEEHRLFSMPAFEDPLLFGKAGRVWVEFCSGNGDWVVERAKSAPRDHFLAVEKRFDRVRKIWTRMQREKLLNLMIVCGEALTFCRDYLPSCSLAGIFVNFPDPWPKQKHAKHRLIRPAFVAELARVVQLEGSAEFVTDDALYRDQMVKEMAAHRHWQSAYGSPFYQTEKEGYGSSWFQELWQKKGRELYYLEFKRSGDSVTSR